MEFYPTRFGSWSFKNFNHATDAKIYCLYSTDGDFKEGIFLKEMAVKLGYITPEQFDEWVDPMKMVGKD